jgi:hypothetical protein
VVARQVFQAKDGRGYELVALFKEFNTRMREAGETVPRFRILTDAAGSVFTVVTEVESLVIREAAFSPAGCRLVSADARALPRAAVAQP